MHPSHISHDNFAQVDDFLMKTWSDHGPESRNTGQERESCQAKSKFKSDFIVLTNAFH